MMENSNNYTLGHLISSDKKKKRKGDKQSSPIVWSLDINSSSHYVTGPDINQ